MVRFALLDQLVHSSWYTIAPDIIPEASMVDAKPHANPDELEAMARRIRAEAENLANALGPFDRAANGAGWRGLAATQFKDDADAKQRTAQALANQLRQVASALDAGAAEIRRYLRELQMQKERLPLPPGKR